MVALVTAPPCVTGGLKTSVTWAMILMAAGWATIARIRAWEAALLLQVPS